MSTRGDDAISGRGQYDDLAVAANAGRADVGRREKFAAHTLHRIPPQLRNVHHSILLKMRGDLMLSSGV
jgi:hypothetical protein